MIATETLLAIYPQAPRELAMRTALTEFEAAMHWTTPPLINLYAANAATSVVWYDCVATIRIPGLHDAWASKTAEEIVRDLWTILHASPDGDPISIVNAYAMKSGIIRIEIEVDV
jgi:hypothetical protein